MDPTDKLGALWQRTSAKGDYFTGTINGAKVVIFANRFKTEEKHPDWIVYKSTPKEAA